jgi:hypothetical protein
MPPQQQEQYRAIAVVLPPVAMVHDATRDHCCPADQRGERAVDRAHRMRQLSQNILGLIA